MNSPSLLSDHGEHSIEQVNAPLWGRNRRLSGDKESGLPEGSEILVERIGADLNRGIFPRVLNGGLVVPDKLAVSYSSGTETLYDSARSRSFITPQVRSQPASQRRASSTTTTGATSSTPSFERQHIEAIYQAELNEILSAYPRTNVCAREDGLWLLAESEVIPGLGRVATFLVGISYSDLTVRAWGFWRTYVVGVTWIGPRHTNFPDGSICAFTPNDNTWRIGNPLVALLDIYTVWAFRQLYLELSGTWPGPQIAFHPYERLVECKSAELCGCGSATVYANCCRQKDLQRNRIKDALSFTRHFFGGHREPPKQLSQVLLGVADFPMFDVQ